MRFEHNMDDFFNKNHDFYTFSKDFFKQFPKKENEPHKEKVMLMLSNNEPINHNFLLKIDSLNKLLKQNSSVDKVYDLVNQKLFVFTAFGSFPYKLIHLNEPAKFKADTARINDYPDIQKRLVSKDWKSMLIFVEMDTTATIDTIIKAENQFKLLANAAGIKNVNVYNTELTNYHVMKKLGAKSFDLTVIAFFLVLIILFVFMRTLSGVLIPLSIVVVSVIWIIGTISFLNIPLNVLTIAVPVIVGVISLSDVIHIVARYSEEQNPNKWEKLKLTQKDMLRAILLTSITTSMGFLSLIPSNIQVFIEFGFFSTLGVLYAFILAYILLPILMHYSKPLKLTNYLNLITPQKLYPKATTIVSVLVIGLSIAGLLMVKNESLIYDDINAKDEASLTVKKLETEFYGIRDLSLAITLTDSSKNILDLDVIQQLEKINIKAEEIYGLANDQSPMLFIKQINRASNGGNPNFYSIPSDEKSYKKILKRVKKAKNYLPLDMMIDSNNKSTYIYGKTSDPGSSITFERNAKLLSFVKNNVPPYIKLTITGGSHVIDRTNVVVTKTMILNLTLIMLAIMVLIMVLFKSVKIGLLSLFPNMLPLLVIIGVVGWFNMGLSVTISIVFTIVFGIAVDDTIHFLSRYRIESQKNQSSKKAIENCIKTTGGAISLTTIILIAGFGTLLFSDFRANFTTGLLVSIGLIVALLCDLFLFPLLLNAFAGKKSK